jgi:large subunit ribosomal protein L35
MPKQKTNRGAAKRFKMTGTGKLKRRKAYLRHILTSKTKKQKRHLRKSVVTDPTNAKAIQRLLPYL